MDDILKRIIEIEDKAQNIVEDAKAGTANFDSEVETITELMSREIEAKADRRISLIQEYEAKEMEKILSDTEASFNENLERINEMYRENRQQWISDVYNMIINKG